jgi:hypothetical protein
MRGERGRLAATQPAEWATDKPILVQRTNTKRSSLVERVLLEAWTRLQRSDPLFKFSVLVVDSGPLFEGETLCLARPHDSSCQCKESALLLKTRVI